LSTEKLKISKGCRYQFFVVYLFTDSGKCNEDSECDITNCNFCSSNRECVEYDHHFCDNNECGIGDGDCDYDSDCKEDLECGSSNFHDIHPDLMDCVSGSQDVCVSSESGKTIGIFCIQ